MNWTILRLNSYIELFYFDIIFKKNKVAEYIHNKYKMDSLASSIMKSIAVFSSRSRFAVNLIYLLLLNQHQVLIAYLNLLLSFYSNF